MFQAESVRDAAFGCDWVGTPIPFQRRLMFIIATANKEFRLTAGKFVPVSNFTAMSVCIYVCVCVHVCMYLFIYQAIHENINVLPCKSVFTTQATKLPLR
jgi:hypothetical protein